MESKEIKEFFDALNYISTEKGVDVNTVINKLKSAITLAVRKQYGRIDKIDVLIDVKNYKYEIFFSKLVVAEIKNKNNEILLQDAKKYDENAKEGEYIKIKVNAKKIGRLAATAAKQQIVQGIKEIERESVIEKIGDKIGRIITEKIDMIDPVFGNVIFKIDDNEVILFKNQQLLNDSFAVGDMVKVYAIEVDSTKSGSLIKISRTHPNFVKSLFELEVPEIEEKKVEIKKIARQAGLRTKIAVCSNDENIDAVGCFIGSRGARVEEVVNELNGEKIDIVKYSENDEEFVASALLPSKALAVKVFEIEGIEKVAYVLISKSQISLAIGVQGLNVKLAAMLTGFKIEILSDAVVSQEEFYKTALEKFEERVKDFSKDKFSKKDEKTKEEQEEEEDIHAIEIEKMLREEEKI